MEFLRYFGIIFTLLFYSHNFACADSDPYENLQNHQFDDHDHAPGEPLSPQDFENAESLVIQTPPSESDDEDPIEIAGEYEGDIIINSHLLNEIQSDKNAIKDDAQKWKNGEIPYLISSHFAENERSVIARAMLEYHRRTCIKFKPRDREPDYVQIVKGQGCSSPVGRKGGSQQLTLGPGCVYVGIAIHELMHAVGFWHEQSRWDRDDFVTVYFENIKPGMEFNFQKYNWNVIQHLGANYDTNSIMHYGPYAFSKDKRYPTIIPKNPNDRIGQRQNFSEVDVQKINTLYKCKSNRPGHVTPPVNSGTSPATPTIITTTESAQLNGKCSDSHENCKKWAEMGECSRNPSWMHVNCKLSCDKCDGVCSDVNKHCPTWARNNECEKNPGYMNSYCQRSCKKCDKEDPPQGAANNNGSGRCEDKDKYCKSWASSGECEKNPKFMLKTCKKSCKSCQQGISSVDENEIDNENEVFSTTLSEE